MDAHSTPFQSTSGSSGVRFFSPLRVVALGLVAAAAGFAAWQLREESREGSVPLLADTLLPSSELALMEAAFDRAKLTDYAIDGGRILVPKGRQSSYMRALVDAEALPREFGGSLRRAMETSSPWQSRAAQDERLRIATQEELSLVLCSMPGIRRAAVLYDQEPRAGLSAGATLGSGPRQTASVNIETDEDAALDRVRARSIRVLVAASIAGLDPEDVAVTDLRSGLVYAGPLETVPADVSPAEAERIALEERIAERIRRSLAYVQGAVVDVRAELGAPLTAEAVKPLWHQKAADANTPADVRRALDSASSPQTAATLVADGRQILAVHAAVAVPQSSTVGTENEIRQHVLELLPSTADPQARSVTVTCFPVGTSAIPLNAERLTKEPTASGGSVPTAAQQRLVARPGSPVEVSTSFPFSTFSIDSLSAPSEQIWISILALAGLVFAGLLWWSSSRRQPHVDHGATIDWTADAHEQSMQAGPHHDASRVAASLLAVCLLCSSAAWAGEPPASLSPTPLAAPVPLVEPGDDSTDEAIAEAISAAEDASTPAAGFEVAAGLAMAAAVVGLFALGWFGKKQSGGLPRDVFEVLGSGQLDRGHRVAIVRFGPKTLLVSVGSSGCSTLSELQDAKATEAIAHACRHQRPTGQPRSTPRSNLHTPAQPPMARPLESAA